MLPPDELLVCRLAFPEDADLEGTEVHEWRSSLLPFPGNDVLEWNLPDDRRVIDAIRDEIALCGVAFRGKETEYRR
jgi:hypothetical protein